MLYQGKPTPKVLLGYLIFSFFILTGVAHAEARTLEDPIYMELDSVKPEHYNPGTLASDSIATDRSSYFEEALRKPELQTPQSLQ